MAHTPLRDAFVKLVTPQFVLLLLSVTFLWWLTSQLLAGVVPDQMREIVSAIVGFITGSMVGSGWQFFFGNNKASDDKTEALRDNARAMVNAGMPVGRQGGQDPQPLHADDVTVQGDTVNVEQKP